MDSVDDEMGASSAPHAPPKTPQALLAPSSSRSLLTQAQTLLVSPALASGDVLTTPAPSVAGQRAGGGASESTANGHHGVSMDMAGSENPSAMCDQAPPDKLQSAFVGFQTGRGKLI